jgi:hypothetical protein
VKRMQIRPLGNSPLPLPIAAPSVEGAGWAIRDTALQLLRPGGPTPNSTPSDAYWFVSCVDSTPLKSISRSAAAAGTRRRQGWRGRQADRRSRGGCEYGYERPSFTPRLDWGRGSSRFGRR